MTRISDQDVDSIQMAPGPSTLGGRKRGRAVGVPSARVLMDMLTYSSWPDLHHFSKAVESRVGTSIDDAGFRYPVEDMLGTGEIPFEGVNVFDPLDDVYMSRPAFERAWTRFLLGLVADVDRDSDPVRDQPFWPDFLARAYRLRDRLVAERAWA
jgi:hypothetical protein